MGKINLDIPRMGYFLLVRKRDGDWLSEQIYRTQVKNGVPKENAVYTHVEVLGGGQYSVRVAPPVVKIINWVDTYKGRYVKITRYNNPDYETKGRYKVAFWAASNANTKYDWLGVLRFRVKFLFQRLNKWFCSENTAWALQKECPLAIGKKPDKVFPADFADVREFSTVFEGVIE